MSDTLDKLQRVLDDRRNRIPMIEQEKRNDIAKIEYKYSLEIESIQNEISELESAIGVIIKFDPLASVSPSTGEIPPETLPTQTTLEPTLSIASRRKRKRGRKKSVKGKSAFEAAHAVLEDAEDEFLEPVEVARRAISRGYLGRIYGDDPEKNAASFFDILRRKPHKFIRDEQDRFRLRRENDPPMATHGRIEAYEGSRAWMAEQILESHDRALSATEIAEEIIEKGYVTGQTVRALRNALVTAMDRNPKFVKVDQGIYKLISADF